MALGLQLQVGLDLAHFQQAQAHAAEIACSSGPKIASLTPRCLSTAASHTLQASGRSLHPLAQYAVIGRFNGEAWCCISLPSQSCKSCTACTLAYRQRFYPGPFRHLLARCSYQRYDHAFDLAVQANCMPSIQAQIDG